MTQKPETIQDTIQIVVKKMKSWPKNWADGLIASVWSINFSFLSLTNWSWQDLSSTMLLWNASSWQSKTDKASYSFIDSWLEDYLPEAFQQGQWEPVTLSPVVLQHRGLWSRAHPKNYIFHNTPELLHISEGQKDVAGEKDQADQLPLC